MFGGSRRNDGGLPMTSYSQQSNGSGKSIRMEAPLVRSIRLASWQTKGSYGTIIISVMMMYWGFCELRHSSASIHLTCHSQGCELDIYPPMSRKRHKILFGRHQLVRSEAIRVSKAGEFRKIDTGKLPSYKSGRKQSSVHSKHSTHRGPDDEGNYPDYTIVLRPPEDDKKPTNQEEEEWFEKELNELAPFTTREQSSGNYVLHMRKYNLGFTKRSTRTMVTKVDSYIKQRRHKLTIKENTAISWKGMLAMVLGLFGLLIGILFWQFAEDEKALQKKKPANKRVAAAVPKPSQNNHTRAPIRGAVPQQTRKNY